MSVQPNYAQQGGPRMDLRVVNSPACVVCGGEEPEFYLTGCNHFYHVRCISSWPIKKCVACRSCTSANPSLQVRLTVPNVTVRTEDLATRGGTWMPDELNASRAYVEAFQANCIATTKKQSVRSMVSRVLNCTGLRFSKKHYRQHFVKDENNFDIKVPRKEFLRHQMVITELTKRFYDSLDTSDDDALAIVKMTRLSGVWFWQEQLLRLTKKLPQSIFRDEQYELTLNRNTKKLGVAVPKAMILDMASRNDPKTILASQNTSMAKPSKSSSRSRSRGIKASTSNRIKASINKKRARKVQQQQKIPKTIPSISGSANASSRALDGYKLPDELPDIDSATMGLLLGESNQLFANGTHQSHDPNISPQVVKNYRVQNPTNTEFLQIPSINSRHIRNSIHNQHMESMASASSHKNLGNNPKSYNATSSSSQNRGTKPRKLSSVAPPQPGNPNQVEMSEAFLTEVTSIQDLTQSSRENHLDESLPPILFRSPFVDVDFEHVNTNTSVAPNSRMTVTSDVVSGDGTGSAGKTVRTNKNNCVNPSFSGGFVMSTTTV